MSRANLAARTASDLPVVPVRFLSDEAEGEGGMLSLVSLFVVLSFMALFAMVTNVGKTVTQKIEVQNGADSVAYAAGLEMARGMNSITAANHLIGELQALCVLHHGFGGDELDNNRRAARTPFDVSVSLTASYALARVFSTGAPQPVQRFYNDVSKDPTVGAAIRDAQIRLKKVMVWAYVGHAIGGLITQLKVIPIVGPILQAIGVACIIACMAFELKVWQEWQVLRGLEQVAKGLKEIKKQLQTSVMPGLNTYARIAQYNGPRLAEEAAEKVGERNKVTVSTFPGLIKYTSYPYLQTYVEQEPNTVRPIDRSQLVRASTPWIQYWRVPVLHFGEHMLLLSRFKCYYQNRTDQFTLTLATRMKRQQGLNLLIIKGLNLNGPGKTNEPWTLARNRREVDKMFCLMGFAHRPKTGGSAVAMFRQANPDGLLAYAQVMVYNANEQKRSRSNGTYQPRAGWDTLNWETPVPETSTCEPEEGTCPVPNIQEPRIRLNWRVKLVPTTRLAEAILFQRDESMRKILFRTQPFTPMSRTH